MSEFTLQDLVDNRTMSASIAETLRMAVREGHSFVVLAIPRHAGKSTTLEAMLDERAKGLPACTVTGTPAEQETLRQTRAGGYLVIPEISSGRSANAPSSYIWGESVRRVFTTLASGYSLALTLHASGVAEAFDILSKKDGIPDDEASRIRLAVVHPIDRRVGEPREAPGERGPRGRSRHWRRARGATPAPMGRSDRQILRRRPATGHRPRCSSIRNPKGVKR